MTATPGTLAMALVKSAITTLKTVHPDLTDEAVRTCLLTSIKQSIPGNAAEPIKTVPKATLARPGISSARSRNPSGSNARASKWN